MRWEGQCGKAEGDGLWSLTSWVTFGSSVLSRLAENPELSAELMMSYLVWAHRSQPHQPWTPALPSAGPLHILNSLPSVLDGSSSCLGLQGGLPFPDSPTSHRPSAFLSSTCG